MRLFFAVAIICLTAALLTAGCVGTNDSAPQPQSKQLGKWYAVVSSEIVNDTEICDGYLITIWENNTAAVATTHTEKRSDQDSSLTEWVNGTVIEEGTRYLVSTERYGNFTLTFSDEKHWEPKLLVTPEGTELELHIHYTVYDTARLV